MPALVTELVNDAMRAEISVSNLLRRTLVTASRLGLPDLVNWLNSELSGYTSAPVPDYREVRGVPMCESELGGWMPLEVRSPQANALFSKRLIFTSIPELERLVVSGASMLVFFSPEFEAKLRRDMNPPTRPAVEVQASQLFGLIEQVRSRILQWALDLESKGVLGEGLSFTTEERQIVAAQHYHFGDVTGSQIQIGSSGSSQSITQADSSAALSGLIRLLNDALASNEIRGEEAAELAAELATLEAQAGSPKPKPSIIKETALSIRRVLEGIAGGALATAAAPFIQALLS
ncbi:hypothetical protein [Pseudomonas putida]|uniref:AbiTii domain-containing protein n=1 Tax=Pseudomonas putida TaxID=303 RepID=A0A9X8EKK8_PSEPU|nr:hypothetical protein [Pseudomonas putida]ROQ53668.1 hypothetical protein EDF85_1432 [Pseudomonas putida]